MPALKRVCHHHESHRHDAKRGNRIHQSIHPSVALAVELTVPGSAIPFCRRGSIRLLPAS